MRLLSTLALLASDLDPAANGSDVDLEMDAEALKWVGITFGAIAVLCLVVVLIGFIVYGIRTAIHNHRYHSASKTKYSFTSTSSHIGDDEDDEDHYVGNVMDNAMRILRAHNLPGFNISGRIVDDDDEEEDLMKEARHMYNAIQSRMDAAEDEGEEFTDEQLDELFFIDSDSDGKSIQKKFQKDAAKQGQDAFDALTTYQNDAMNALLGTDPKVGEK